MMGRPSQHAFEIPIVIAMSFAFGRAREEVNAPPAVEMMTAAPVVKSVTQRLESAVCHPVTAMLIVLMRVHIVRKTETVWKGVG